MDKALAIAILSTSICPRKLTAPLCQGFFICEMRMIIPQYQSVTNTWILLIFTLQFQIKVFSCPVISANSYQDHLKKCKLLHCKCNVNWLTHARLLNVPGWEIKIICLNYWTADCWKYRMTKDTSSLKISAAVMKKLCILVTFLINFAH